MRAIALADAVAGDGCGSKAAALGAMLRAGLPVPDGFALGHDVFVAVTGGGDVPAAIADDVAARVARRGRLAVRSSMSIEDAQGGAGAGVFVSQVDVDPADVWTAIRAVWASASTPLALAYARQRGASAVEVGVIVQRFVAGTRVTIYTRPPGAPDRDEAWIEAAGAEVSRVPRDAHDPRVVLAMRAEAAIDAPAGAGLVYTSPRPRDGLRSRMPAWG